MLSKVTPNFTFMSEAQNYKVAVIGNHSTGKTCLIKRAVYDVFDLTLPTSCSDIYAKSYQVDLQTVKLIIWDTAGQERFNSLGKLYYENAAAVIVVYAVDDNSSQNIMTHIDAVRNCNQNCLLFLACNKIDLDADNQDTNIEIGKNIALQNNIPFYEVSAKVGINVNDMFFEIARNLGCRIYTKHIPLIPENQSSCAC